MPETSLPPETHQAALELSSSPHADAAGAAREVAALRAVLARELGAFRRRAASAGTHPFAVWTETEVAIGTRQQLVHDSMRELARDLIEAVEVLDENRFLAARDGRMPR